MSRPGPFDPHKEAPLLSAFVDDELGPEDRARIEAHLETDPATRAEVEKLQRLKDVTGVLRLKEPPPEQWEIFWENVYNRAERSLGWLLLCLALVVIGSWAVLQVVGALWSADMPLYLKGAILAGVGGTLVLLISVIRERVYKRNRTRYKDVIR